MYVAVKCKCRTLYWIFFHNEQANTSYITDTVLDPFYWLVEQVAKKAGPIFVTLVALLTTSVVVIYYQYALPWSSKHWPFPLTLFNYIFGHWLLLNIVFHYVMAVKTPPGKPPYKVDSPVSICKSCVSPKPCRTHHCSVCKQCILKMDHHCPWLNNCVGHFNHRYFYLFCVYMCLGTIFVTISMYGQFTSFFSGSPLDFLLSALTPAISILRAWYTSTQPLNHQAEPGPTNALPTALPAAPLSAAPLKYSPEEIQIRFWVSYEFFLCVGVTLALGSLVVFHTRLISRGETSIEKHINSRERKRMNQLGTTYRNPYDFGLLQNWKMFLGIEEGSGRSWRHVLLPSPHKPTGDGKAWRTFSTKFD